MELPGIAWDASCLLNLAATDQAAGILTSLRRPCFVARQVLVREVLYVRPLPEEDPEERLRAADLSPLLEAGLLQEVMPTPEELTTYVELLEELDDGEAITGAIAAHRGLAVATADRPALRVLRAHEPPVPVLTTPEWVRLWAATESVSEEVLATVLRRIALCARYHPASSHALYEWWAQHYRAS